MDKDTKDEVNQLILHAINHLQTNNILFERKNDGVHLVVEGTTCRIDFWPITGKWATRRGVKGYGLRNLITFITGKS